MTITDAISRGNAHILQHRGVSGHPDLVRVVDAPGKPRSWRLLYNAKLFYPDDIINDGGECVLVVSEDGSITSPG